jgi:hypothetical protein
MYVPSIYTFGYFILQQMEAKIKNRLIKRLQSTAEGRLYVKKKSNGSKIDDIQGSRLQINRATQVNFLGLPLLAPWTWALGLLVQLVGFVYKLS